MVKPVGDNKWKELVIDQETCVKQSANVFHILRYGINSDEIKNEKWM